MFNWAIVGVISVSAIILGLIKYGSLASSYKHSPWQLKFVEIWNDFINFFVAGLVAYFFIQIRLPILISGGALNGGDFGLFAIFMLGSFGHLCVMSKNITDGVEAIIKRVLDK
jgi:hypothetical protein